MPDRSEMEPIFLLRQAAKRGLTLPRVCGLRKGLGFSTLVKTVGRIVTELGLRQATTA